ncbi:SseB family protein [Streptomyces cupreus]|uniref:SseB family protein n=1 Tax=Streptomyces cupreus TaxID=2759956 RepID=A0A7X1MC28_9ACTN|nr:SseB family protein [Streptomyces cupreus]MBC2905797.1 SseB family protein [Streptomyces cupreus]
MTDSSPEPIAARIRRALDALADDRHAPVPAWVHALAEGEVLVPQADEAGRWRPSAAVPVPVVRHREDGPFVPVFTSEATVAAALSYTTPCQRVRLGVLAAVWPGEDVSLAVDPGSPDALTVDAADVQLLFGLHSS